jgi:phage shock protein PspC (stress-responsive transcriptional regulator)
VCVRACVLACGVGGGLSNRFKYRPFNIQVICFVLFIVFFQPNSLLFAFKSLCN